MDSYKGKQKQNPSNEYNIFDKYRGEEKRDRIRHGFLDKKLKKNLHGFGLLANYADRATAACWRSSANFCG
jgi:hypothetical protein